MKSVFFFALALLSVLPFSYSSAQSLAVYVQTQQGSRYNHSLREQTGLFTLTTANYTETTYVIRDVAARRQAIIPLKTVGGKKTFQLQSITNNERDFPSYDGNTNSPYFGGGYLNGYFEFPYPGEALPIQYECLGMGPNQSRTLWGFQKTILLPKSQVSVTTPLILSGPFHEYNMGAYDNPAFLRNRADITARINLSLSDQANMPTPIIFGDREYAAGTIAKGIVTVVNFLKASGYKVQP